VAQWYVVQCKPREERRALENLRRQGFSCYLPMLTVEKLRHHCVRSVLEPLFPGYLFISLNELTDNWHPIRSTRGVVQLVRIREYPIPMPDTVIESIRARLATDGFRVPHLRPGEAVRITEGPFTQVEAIFVANDGQERVVLLMNILNHEQRMSFPARTVRRLDGRAVGSPQDPPRT
jgi:transcriptional antiterminator RfaH